MGMQTRFNFSPLTFFYLEPRIGIYSDGIDGIKTWMRYDWEASLMAGLGYRLLSDPVRRKAPFFGADQGFFVSVEGGMATTLTSGSGLLLDPRGYGYAVDWKSIYFCFFFETIWIDALFEDRRII